MKSIWRENVLIPQREPLNGDVKTQVAVIGGGLAGILTAYFLQKRGKEVIVLEASSIGSGQTENTTAKITAQHNLIYHSLIQDFGLEKAKQYAEANKKAISEYKRIINEEQINCQFEERPAYLYSMEDTSQLEQEARAARQLGFDCLLTSETDLPFQVKSALKFNEQAQFHPLEFLKKISETLTIYEHTEAKEIEENCIITEKGKVTAEQIIITTHYPYINVPGYYFMRMHQERSYVIALKKAKEVNGMYLNIDQDGYSLRNSRDILLFGGGQHRTGENSSGGKYEKLRSAAKEFFPESIEIDHWSAQDCMTLDGVPYIGHFSSSTPNCYVATGFGKWGMTNSMVSAMIISDLIEGKENPYANVFSPQRFKFSASAKTLIEDGMQAVKGLVTEIFTLPEEEINQLPNGHGGIVEFEGHKVGVYKDEQGKAYIVSTRCTHLGCQLEWNPDELSWDCPCHGSRFDYKGNLINNPAMKDIKG
ncbi:FAD-dependent oxidoreductase [Aminipila terrae]|uniref:FAD-dependent oxidoreductase n=1 Tax=Aminipila terrae TaxID=2697030 RepID=A0A6P1MJF3_9FIRM|nr:FAD-dependent oxidoreductase [Aminipila terrae]QHI72754.1 FAD-dependent oxidoreductase [Aminipila terrae]